MFCWASRATLCFVGVGNADTSASIGESAFRWVHLLIFEAFRMYLYMPSLNMFIENANPRNTAL